MSFPGVFIKKFFLNVYTKRKGDKPMIYIPEEFFNEYILSKSENEIRKYRNKVAKRITKLEKNILKNKVCYDYLPYESQLIIARQQYDYINHVFCDDEIEVIRESETRIKEILEIIREKKAYEIIDKKKLRYNNAVARINEIVGVDSNYKENYDFIKNKDISTYTKQEVITRITYIYNQDYEGYDSFVSNIEDGTITELLERYLEA